MPTYGYECLSCKLQFETFQRITEDALKVHDACGGELRRLLYPVGIVFKGPGFHVNDYAKKSGSEPKAETKIEASGESKSDSRSDPKSDSRSDSKAESTSDSKADGKTGSQS